MYKVNFIFEVVFLNGQFLSYRSTTEKFLTQVVDTQVPKYKAGYIDRYPSLKTLKIILELNFKILQKVFIFHKIWLSEIYCDEYFSTTTLIILLLCFRIILKLFSSIFLSLFYTLYIFLQFLKLGKLYIRMQFV